MPVSRITTNFKFKNAPQFVEHFHIVMCSVLNIKDYDRLVILDEKPSGFFQPTNTSGKYVLFEISMFPERGLETKRKLYHELVMLCAKFSVKPENVRIMLNLVSRENWGIRGGQAACDVVLGYKTDI